jgi:hypothetical protein
VSEDIVEEDLSAMSVVALFTYLIDKMVNYSRRIARLWKMDINGSKIMAWSYFGMQWFNASLHAGFHGDEGGFVDAEWHICHVERMGRGGGGY